MAVMEGMSSAWARQVLDQMRPSAFWFKTQTTTCGRPSLSGGLGYRNRSHQNQRSLLGLR